VTPTALRASKSRPRQEIAEGELPPPARRHARCQPLEPPAELRAEHRGGPWALALDLSGHSGQLGASAGAMPDRYPQLEAQ